MKNRFSLTDADLQDYIENRLDSPRRDEVEQRLAADPQLAEEVRRLRRQADKLRDIGRTMLDEPIPDEMLDLIKRFPRE